MQCFIDVDVGLTSYINQSVDISIGQSVKTHWYSAICRKWSEAWDGRDKVLTMKTLVDSANDVCGTVSNSLSADHRQRPGL